MSTRLRELIRHIRACKTAADERRVIAKESALIRTSLKDEDSPYRARNVAKLMYIHMMGYPTQFGQMECIRLISSPKFPEKRIGYLGLMILLDENQEVLTLIENSLKKDLNDVNQFIQALALSTIGNIASVDICRDLAPEVEKILVHGNPYLKKKASLCAVRIFRKVPELIEDFVERIGEMFTEKSHGVVLCAVKMAIEVLTIKSELAESFRRYVNVLVRILKTLQLSAYAVEHDVGGISDPFLQANILHLLRLLGKGDKRASDEMSDILAQVATNTDNTKVAGNSILYECVQTIMEIESESGLRVLAINILGRFLLNRDSNIRYVALNTLSKVVTRDNQAVQRHRNFIVDCLKDHDISIRKRALELLYSLVNEKNIVQLIPELVDFLLVSDVDFKEDLTAKICTVVERYAPDNKWHVDTLIQVLSMAGVFVREDVTTGLIALISRDPSIQEYSARQLFLALRDNPTQEVLVQVSSWCMGEFGEQLTAGNGMISASDIITLLASLLRNQNFTFGTREYILTALVKLAARFPDEIEKLKKVQSTYSTSIYLELQQRACEYKRILELGQDSRTAILQRMPQIPPKDAKLAQKIEGKDVHDEHRMAIMEAPSPFAKSAPSSPQQREFDLLGLGEEVGRNSTLSDTNSRPSQAPFLDLDELFGGPSTQAQNAGEPSRRTDSDETIYTSMSVFEEDGLTVTFDLKKNKSLDPSSTQITAYFRNGLRVPMENYVFQVAVPKYMKLKMNPPSSTTVAPNLANPTTQLIEVNNTLHGQKPVMLRVRVQYTVNTQQVSKQFQISNFPPGI